MARRTLFIDDSIGFVDENGKPLSRSALSDLRTLAERQHSAQFARDALDEFLPCAINAVSAAGKP